MDGWMDGCWPIFQAIYDKNRFYDVEEMTPALNQTSTLLKLDFYSASSPRQHPAGRHDAPH